VDVLSIDALVIALGGASDVEYVAHTPIVVARLVQASTPDLACVVRDNVRRAAEIAGVPLHEAPTPAASCRYVIPPEPDTRSTVVSIQRLPLPRGRDAAWAAREYARWCDHALGPVRAVVDADATVHLRIRPSSTDVLVLAPQLDTPDRYVWRIAGGRLARTNQRGTFEMRCIADELFAIVHDFEPSLPWWIYRATEAPAHVRVMHAFGRAIVRRDSPDMA
jgi:hypothetical protein